MPVLPAASADPLAFVQGSHNRASPHSLRRFLSRSCPTRWGAERTGMWKSFLLAAGVFACIVGVELLVIDSAVIQPLDGRGGPQVFTAPDWAPWSLISAGAVTVLNFFSLPTKAVKDFSKI